MPSKIKKEVIVIHVGVAILVSVLIAIALGLTFKPKSTQTKDTDILIEEPKPVMTVSHTNIYRICIDDRLFILTKSTYSSSEATLTQVFSAYGAAADCWEKKGTQ